MPVLNLHLLGPRIGQRLGEAGDREIHRRGPIELVTVVGHAAAISAGEWITAAGDWVNDRTHGQQFKARFLKTSMPTSVEGIEKYLASA
jgi:exodeoxyribonuclease V alpha subunit